MIPEKIVPEGPPPSVSVAGMVPSFVTLFDPIRNGVVNTTPSGRVTFAPFRLSVAAFALDDAASQAAPTAAAAKKKPAAASETPRHGRAARPSETIGGTGAAAPTTVEAGRAC